MRHNPPRLRLALLVIALLAGLWVHLSRRAPHLVGVFAAETGVGRLEFQSGGRVYVTAIGGTYATRYELDGERVILTGGQTPQVLRLEGDRIVGGFGERWIRVLDE